MKSYYNRQIKRRVGEECKDLLQLLYQNKFKVLNKLNMHMQILRHYFCQQNQFSSLIPCNRMIKVSDPNTFFKQEKESLSS